MFCIMNIENTTEFLKISTKRDKFEYFSKGILSSSLYSIGMDANNAFEVASLVENVVSELPKPINKKKLIKIITDEIEKIDKRLAERYKVYEGEGNYKPIIVDSKTNYLFQISSRIAL